MTDTSIEGSGDENDLSQDARDIRDLVRRQLVSAFADLLSDGAVHHADELAEVSLKTIGQWLEFSFGPTLDAYASRYADCRSRLDRVRSVLEERGP